MKFIDKKLKEFRDKFNKVEFISSQYSKKQRAHIVKIKSSIPEMDEIEQFIKEALEEAHMEGVRDISKIYGVTIPDDARMAKLKSEQEEQVHYCHKLCEAMDYCSGVHVLERDCPACQKPEEKP